jgi:hypothetical protein
MGHIIIIMRQCGRCSRQLKEEVLMIPYNKCDTSESSYIGVVYVQALCVHMEQDERIELSEQLI